MSTLTRLPRLSPLPTSFADFPAIPEREVEAAWFDAPRSSRRAPRFVTNRPSKMPPPPPPPPIDDPVADRWFR